MKIKLAILEKDQSYLNRIVSVFNNKFADKLEIYSFTDYDVALNTLENTKIDMFIACDAFKIDVDKIPKRCGFAYFVDSLDIESIHEQRTICKFQKAELIYKEVLSIYSETTANVTGVRFDDNSSVKLCTFVSASGGTGSSTVAAACAITIAKRGSRVLYLNFEHFGRANSYFHAQGQFDFGDVIYAIKSRKSNLALKLESMVKQDASGVYFYDSSKTALDMIEVSTDDMDKLLTELKTMGSYDYIVVDMDFSFNKTNIEVMKNSSSLVFVSDGSEVANIKFNRAMEALDILDQQSNSYLLSRVAVIYNQFRNKTSKEIENSDIKILGGAPKFEGASTTQVVEQLSAMRLFDKLF